MRLTNITRLVILHVRSCEYVAFTGYSRHTSVLEFLCDFLGANLRLVLMLLSMHQRPPGYVWSIGQ